MDTYQAAETQSGIGARLLNEKGVVLRALTGRSSLPLADTAPAILDELCFWTLEVDRIVERQKLSPESNQVRHFLSVVEQAHGALANAEKSPEMADPHLRRAKVLVFALARLAKRLESKSRRH